MESIAAPEYIEPSVKGRNKCLPFFKRQILRVTFREETDHILVITVTVRKKPFKE